MTRLDVLIPDGVRASGTAIVVVRIGDVSTQPGVTVAVSENVAPAVDN